MSMMNKRLLKLEKARGSVAERLFIVITALDPGPNGPVEHDPIALSPLCKTGRLIRRLPGESVEDLHARAVRERPEVPVWVTRYRGDENET